MIDFLCFQAGEMGALNILAEIEESHLIFELLRDTGFSVYSWESIWKLPTDLNFNIENSCWQIPDAVDENCVRSLYQTLVPPLVQNAEPFSDGSSPRLVYKKENEVLAYVESINGMEGIYLIPVIHPSVEDIQLLLQDLVYQFRGLGKPVYLQVRSYQAWLSETLSLIKAESSPRFALLVKHLAVSLYSKVASAQRSRSTDQRQTEPTAPILQNCSDQTPTVEVSK